MRVISSFWSALMATSPPDGSADLARIPKPTTRAVGPVNRSIYWPPRLHPLERHLELQRFRALPDLQDGELQRLLAAADANARELLGTMGYFAPTITVLMTDTPESKAALRAVVVVVEPGPQTRIASTQITVADSTDKDTESPARRGTRSQVHAVGGRYAFHVVSSFSGRCRPQCGAFPAKRRHGRGQARRRPPSKRFLAPNSMARMLSPLKVR